MITGVVAAFVQGVLPVLLIGGLGYLVGRARSLDLAPITGLTVLVLVPAIVFDSLARATLPRDLLSRLALHVTVQLVAVWLLTVVVARLAGWRGPAQGGLLLATLFSNSGNVGLPLAPERRFTFSPAISFFVRCETQAEVDHFWEKLSAGGEIQQCGWLKDKYGVSWQIVPTVLGDMLADQDAEKARRVMHVMLQMKKLDIKRLKQAYAQR